MCSGIARRPSHVCTVESLVAVATAAASFMELLQLIYMAIICQLVSCLGGMFFGI